MKILRTGVTDTLTAIANRKSILVTIADRSRQMDETIRWLDRVPDQLRSVLEAAR